MASAIPTLARADQSSGANTSATETLSVLYIGSDYSVYSCSGRLFETPFSAEVSLCSLEESWVTLNKSAIDFRDKIQAASDNREALDIESAQHVKHGFYCNISIVPQYAAAEVGAESRGACLIFRELDKKTLNAAFSPNIDAIVSSLGASGQALWFWEPRSDSLHDYGSTDQLSNPSLLKVASSQQTISERCHPDDRQLLFDAMNNIGSGKVNEFTVEHREVNEHGAYRWLRTVGKAIDVDSNGTPSLVAGTYTDIDHGIEQRIRHESTLEHNRTAVEEAKDAWQFLQLILDEIPDKIFWKDEQHRLIGCNKAYASICGFDSPSDVVGRTTEELYPPALARVYENDDNHVLSTSNPIINQERFAVDANGNDFWVSLTKLPLNLKLAGTQTRGLLCHYRDITLERARRKQLETLAEIMSSDAGDRILDRLVNGAAELAEVDIAFVGRYNEFDRSVTIIASCSPGANLDGVTYDLEDTPCQSVFSEHLCLFDSDLKNRFPNDQMLQDMDIAGYAGRRLLDHHGKTVGLFVLMHTKPLQNNEQTVSIIDIVSSPATYELMRETRESALIESEKRYRNIYDSVPVMICTTDENHNISDINSRWIGTTGYIHGDVIGKPLTGLFEFDDRPLVLQTIENAWTDNDAEDPAEDRYLRLIGVNGEEIIVKHTAVYTSTAGNNGVTINVIEDAREKYKAAQQLRLAATAFETQEALVIRNGSMEVLRVNAAFTEITGYQQSDIIDTNFNYFMPDDEADTWKVAAAEGKWQGNGNCRRAIGPTFSAYQTVTAVKDESGKVTHFVENFNDITDYVEALAETERLAYFDSLTELPNRRQLTERLEESLSAAKRHGTYGALMFIDLDHFKNINDAVGHSVGDQVLQQVSKRLLKLLRKEDTIARLGGDEFVVLIPQVSTDCLEVKTQAANIASKIQRDLRRLYYIEDHEFHITPTIGVTLFPYHDSSVDDVLKQADTAMYRAKEEGRNQTKFYDASMQDLAQERLSIEKDLRTAVQRQELHLVFQPQVTPSGKVFGAESLLRWNHPTRGLISPAVFIPIAEETGLIIEIGRWVLDEAFKVLARWEEALPDGILDHLSINVSSRQFSGQDFVEDVARRMEAHGTNAHKVVLEVTESTVIDKIQATVSKMEELKKLGVRFSVDDFGTGYSSLAYLSRLPLDQLKIDRTFVTNIHQDPGNAVIVETIISMGRHLGLQTVAEGVEDESQLQFLNERGCNAYQGYYFAKPLELADFERFLMSNSEEFS